MNREQQVIWAAGFFDGEAYMGLSRGTTTSTQRPFHQALVDVAQVKRAPLDVLVSLFGGRIRVGKNRCGAIYYWRVSGTRAYRVLCEVQPYLVGKQRQARLLIEFGQTLTGRNGLGLSSDVVARREAMYTELRVLNSRRVPSHAERLSEKAPQAEPLRMVR